MKDCTQVIRVKQNVHRIIQKDYIYDPAILFELRTWAEDSLFDAQHQHTDIVLDDERESNEHIAHFIEETTDADEKLY